MQDQFFMQKALALALRAKARGEVPVGALVVLDNKIIGRGYNCPISTEDPTAHAEIIALRKAAKKVNNYRLTNTTLYVTLEPCMMCLGASIHARVSRIVFGAYDLKKISTKINIIGGIEEDQCSKMLKNFFKARR